MALKICLVICQENNILCILGFQFRIDLCISHISHMSANLELVLVKKKKKSPDTSIHLSSKGDPSITRRIGKAFSTFIIEVKTPLWLVASLCPILCDPMDCSMSGLPVHHQLPELAQAQVRLTWWCHPTILCLPLFLLLSIFSAIRVFFQWLSSPHQVAKVCQNLHLNQL